jgi:hypothetical protein
MSYKNKERESKETVQIEVLTTKYTKEKEKDKEYRRKLTNHKKASHTKQRRRKERDSSDSLSCY